VTLLLWVLTAIVLPLLLSEFTDLCPWLAKKLVRRAARRLPEPDRPRWEAEWLAELASKPGQLLKLLWALGLLPGAWKMSRMLGAPSMTQALRTRMRAAWARLRFRPKVSPQETEPKPAIIQGDPQTILAVGIEPASETVKIMTLWRQAEDRRRAGYLRGLRAINPRYSEQDLDRLLAMSPQEFREHVDGISMLELRGPSQHAEATAGSPDGEQGGA
jgi:hypothetical protein